MNPSARLSFLIKDYRAMRQALEFLLELFAKYNIPATWAIVGRLLWNMCEEHDKLSRDSLYFSKGMFEKIVSSPIGHEIGYHSFSHPDFSKCSREIAEAEIRTGVRLANDLGVKFKSFVFPFNKIGHVDVLKENGFEIYRAKNLERCDIDQAPVVRKINAAIDLITPPSTTQPRWIEGMWSVSSCMVFFVNHPAFTPLLTLRAKLGILRAISVKEIFHVFLHPWNLLQNPSLRKELDKLLAFVSRKKEENGLHISTMRNLVSLLRKKARE